MRAKASELVLGSGFDPNVTQGPLISKQSVNNLHGLVQNAVYHGAKLVIGGHSKADMDDRFFEPTILVDAPPAATIYSNEVG